MADDKPAPNPAPPKPPPPPPEPKVIPSAKAQKPGENIAQRAANDIAAVKTKNDHLRPFRYVYHFITGSLRDGLNGTARWGSTGLKLGTALGVVVAIALSALAPIMIGAAAGFIGGAVLGGAKGFITGGMSAVAKQRRTEVYAEDLVVRKQVREKAPVNKADYRDSYNAQARRNAILTQQVLERDLEATRDFNTYWRDQVSNQPASSRGVGV